MCDYCSNNNASEIKVHNYPPWKELYHDDCRECFQTKWLNGNGSCESCHSKNSKLSLRVVKACSKCVEQHKLKKLCDNCSSIVEDYAEGTMECIPCHYSKSFTLDPGYSVGVCRQCFRTTHLDQSSTCRNCHTMHNIESAQNNDWAKVKQCSCGDIINKNKATCPSCANKPVPAANLRKDKQCFGCHMIYKPVSVYDTFCIPCKEAIQRGNCTMCGNLSNTLDHRGWCTQCQSEYG